MRILFLSSRNPYPVIDGHTNRTYHILNGLAHNNQVHLLAMGQTEDASDFNDYAHLREFCEEVEILSAPPKSLSLPMVTRLTRSLISSKPYTIWRHYSPEFTTRLRELTRHKRFDLVHFDILPMSAYRRGVYEQVCSITDHDVCFLKTKRICKATKNPLLKIFLFLEYRKLFAYEKQVFKKFDIVLAVSEFDAGILKDITGLKNICVIPNGVDTRKFAPSNNNGENKTLLWIGGLSYFPNREAVTFLVHHIYPLIKEKVSDCHLNIVGDYEQPEFTLASLNTEGVSFLGFVPDTLPYLRKAQIFVLPILSGSGTRLKLLEALNWNGLCQADFILDKRTGIPYLIDMNPRFWGSIVQGIASGVDFPYLVYRIAVEGDVEPYHSCKTGVVTRWIGGDVLTFLPLIKEV